MTTSTPTAPHPRTASTTARQIEATIARIAPADAAVHNAATTHLDGLAKPVGSLGRLEELAARIAGIRGSVTVPAPTPAVVVAAADHGVMAESVSAFPQAVTGLMLRAFASGGAAVGVLSRHVGARLVVVDVGVLDPPVVGGVLNRSIRPGSRNSAVEDALTADEVRAAIAVGIGIAEDLVDDGVDLIALGEMGIGNTTTASALTAALLDESATAVCGPGTGLDPERVRHKAEVVTAIIKRNAGLLHGTAEPDAMAVLAAMGGLDVAALTGVTLGAAAARVPVLVDGFITGAAALVAARIAPDCVDSMIASHLSPEPGHALQLEALGLTPLLDFGMRLGEGSGAAVAIPLVRSAVAILTEMASLASLGLGGTED